MGDWVIYSSALNIKDIAERIITNKKYRENPELDKILQRDLKERKKQIAKYLLNDNSRFFNSIIIGVFGGMPQWHEFKIDNKMKEISGESTPDDYFSSVGILEFIGDEEMFAIDGQHRVAGIQIAFQEEQKKKGTQRVLDDDKFPVIFIAHIDDDAGRKRTRKLFSDINNNAKPVAEGDKIKIDEEHLTAIVTRRLYANYKFFDNGRLISLTESAKLENNDVEHFTNLLGLNNTNKVLKKLFIKLPGSKEWDEENVVNLYEISKVFFDYVIKNIEVYDSYFVRKTLSLNKAREGNKYILFRPIGLKLLAGLFVFYKKKYNDLSLLTEKINATSFIMPDSPFNGVLWNYGKMEAKEKNQALALDVALYMYGEYPTDKVESLLNRYREVVKNEKAQLPELTSK